MEPSHHLEHIFAYPPSHLLPSSWEADHPSMTYLILPPCHPLLDPTFSPSGHPPEGVRGGTWDPEGA